MPENGVTVLSPVPDMSKYWKPATEPYGYGQNNPINWNDPSGKQAVKNGGISDEEKQKLMGCTCNLFDQKLGGSALGRVICDGEGGFMIDVLPRDKIEDPTLKACWRCGMEDCNKTHEQHHIKQFEAICPDLCGCQPKGRKAVGFTTDECLQKSECYGWAAFYTCLKEAFEKKFKNDANTKCDAPVNRPCRDVLPILIQQGPAGQAAKYNCKEHKIDVQPN